MESNQRPRSTPTYQWRLYFWQAIIQWTNKSNSNKCWWSNWMSECRILPIDPHLSPCIKLKSSWIKGLNIKQCILHLMGEKVANSLKCIGTVYNLFYFVLFCFPARVSLYSPGCPGTLFVDQAGLELRNLSASASQVLVLKACATTAWHNSHSNRCIVLSFCSSIYI